VLGSEEPLKATVDRATRVRLMRKEENERVLAARVGRLTVSETYS
jgi:hypothetical protein